MTTYKGKIATFFQFCFDIRTRSRKNFFKKLLLSKLKFKVKNNHSLQKKNKMPQIRDKWKESFLELHCKLNRLYIY